ncbi:MAG: hypothetical protein KGH64_00700 [Candidatus Micrarchaeota archaeon]|nr:hypothetical protein [Candidatus Micrarchaeota archaeon]
MKHLTTIVFSACLLARASKSPIPGWVGNTVSDCDKLWLHNLQLAIVNDDDSDYLIKNREVSMQVLDKQLRDSGLKNRFYSFCVHRMSSERLECSLNAKTLEAENFCAILDKGDK